MLLARFLDFIQRKPSMPRPVPSSALQAAVVVLRGRRAAYAVAAGHCAHHILRKHQVDFGIAPPHLEPKIIGDVHTRLW